MVYQCKLTLLQREHKVTYLSSFTASEMIKCSVHVVLKHVSDQRLQQSVSQLHTRPVNLNITKHIYILKTFILFI